MSMDYVIGVGNSLRGDDALGPIVIERLRSNPSRVSTGDSRQLLSVIAPTPELAAEIAPADRVVFIDASREGIVGAIACQQLEADVAGAPAASHPLMTRHGLDIPAVWRISRSLFGARGLAWIISTRGVSFEMAESQLTPEVASCVEGIVARVEELLA